MDELGLRTVRKIVSGHGEMIWSGLAAISIVGSAFGLHSNAVLVITATVLALGALLGSRRAPWPALACAVVADGLVPDDRALLLAVLTVLYVIACRTTWVTVVLAVAVSATATTLGGEIHGGHDIANHGGLLGFAISNTTACVAAAAWGLYVVSHHRVLAGLMERAARGERERELLTERAVAEERIRIAQELHDIVAHNVSLMVVQAQALSASIDSPVVAQTTASIADLGREAMAQMHMTLRLLRIGHGQEPEFSPQPGLGQLSELVEQSRAAGLPIELSISGSPRALAQDVDLSAFRIVQEALTNVIKHAAGASTRVAVAYEPETVTLAVRDITHGPAPEPHPGVGGHGLIGMRERAAMLGGQLTAERLHDGFEVTATLPYASAP